jgi:hypothetical protein
MSEVVLLLPNTDHLQQVEDYVRGTYDVYPFYCCIYSPNIQLCVMSLRISHHLSMKLIPEILIFFHFK